MGKPNRATSPSRRRLLVKPRRNVWIAVLCIGWCALMLLVLRLLQSNNITLGQGSFFYRYSEIQSVRMIRCWPVLVALPIAWLAVVRWRWLGIFLAIFLTAWTWWAPPKQMVQHSFNMRSPSHEGAFLIEAEHITSLRDYLLSFNEHIQESPAQLKGTRVISNPPGMTILAVWVNELFPPEIDPPGMIERQLMAQDVDPQDLAFASKTIRFSIALTALWLLSGFAAYWLGRIFLPAPGALVFSIITCFNPSTLNFSPGKDPAQLLTICAMMACWFESRHALPARGAKSLLCATLAGAIFIIGMICGLIHAWVALAIIIATCWQTGTRKTFVLLLWAIIGSAITVAMIYFLSGWNVLGTLLAVARRFGPIQKTFALDRSIWFFIGLPIFLLFLSPGLGTFIGLTIRRKRVGFGMKLLICTIATMLITYLTGVTYELPRLWIAFLPALTLGAMIDLPISRALHDKALRAMALIVIVSMLAALLSWTYLDARESEYRLITHKFFN